MILIAASCAAVIACVETADAQIPAFPGAEGFGANATGGRGGDVYTVVNLNSSGPGSLRYGIENAPAQGRAILFAVSGYIPVNYNSDTGNQTVRLVQNNIGIYGQTAPGDGIGLKDGRILITGDNSVIRHIRVRHGKYGGAGDCVNIESSAQNTMLDHVTLMFSTDENISFFNSNADQFTFQNSISAWGMERHNAGGLWDLEDGTCHHTLWAHHRTRNPKARPYGLLEWINNVTFHWRSEGFIMGDSTSQVDWYANVIGCYYVSLDDYEFGLDSTPLSKGRIDDGGNPNFHLYLSDTLIDANGNGILDGVDNGYGIVSGVPYPAGGTTPGTVSYDTNSAPFPGAPVAVTIDPPLTAYKKVLSASGALRMDANYGGLLRDELDTLLIDSVVNQKSILVAKDSPRAEYPEDPPSSGEALLAGPPYNISNNGFGTLNSTVAPTDTDGDGMPDFWEQTLGSNPNLDDHNSQVPVGAYLPNIPAGYTLLEEYLYFKSMPHAVVEKNTGNSPSSLSVDLRRYTSGFDVAPVVFSISNQVNCSAVVQPDGYTVVVTPTVDFIGRARFNFNVTDGEGSSWTQTFVMLASGVFVPTDLTWVGDGISNLWDTNSMNFEDGTNTTAFSSGDNVLFDDTGSSSPAINVTGSIYAGVVQVDASQNYTFGGSGVLGGAMALQKSGTGSLTISNTGPNTFGGGSAIGEGTMTLATTDALGFGPVALSGSAALHLGTYSLNSGNTLTISGSPTLTGGNGGGLTDLHAISGSGILNVTVTTGVLDLSGSLSGFNGELQFSGGNYVRFYGSTGGASTEFDLGTGTLELSKRSNDGIITLGALSGGPNTRLVGASGGKNTTSTTYRIGDKDNDTTFSGALANGGGTTGVAKYGSGMLTLAGNSTYTGVTAIYEGTLRVTGSLGSTDLYIGTGARLSGTGPVASLLTLQAGGELEPGNTPGGAGTMNTSGGIHLKDGTLYFDLSDNPASGNDQILNSTGTLTFESPGGNVGAHFVFSLIDEYLSPGTYELMSGGTNTSAPGSPVFTHNLPAGGRQTFTLQRSGGGSTDAYVRLHVEGNAATLVWTGNGGGDWDTSTTNWLNGGTPDKFYNFDAVRLDDSASNKTVNVVGSLQPRSMVVSNATGTYTFSGGTFGGEAGSLLKQGAGTLIINSVNSSFTGTADLTAGTTVLGNVNSLGTADITLSGGAILDLAGSLMYPGNTLNVPGSQSGTLNSSGGLGNGWSGKLVGVSNSALNITSGVSFSGTTSTQFDNFKGTIHIQPGSTLRFSSGSSGNTYGSLIPTFVIDGMLQPRNAGNTIQLGALSGSGTIAGQQTQPVDGGGNGTTTYVIGANNMDASFNGQIIDSNPTNLTVLVKTGTGELVLNGASTFSGGTTISAGTLLVHNTTGSGAGTGDVLVQAGAILGGTGSIAGATTLDDGAILAPGASAGTLTCNGDLTLSDLSYLRYELGTTSDRVIVDGDLVATGLLEVTNTAGYGPGVYPLFTWNTNKNLTLGQLVLTAAPAGYNYSISTNTPGEVNLIVAPTTPPSIGSTVLSSGSLIVAGSGGIPEGDYYVLSSTNLVLPVVSWDVLQTNQFDSSGNFVFTNMVDALTLKRFFRLQVP